MEEEVRFDQRGMAENRADEYRELQERKREYRAYVRSLCSVLGFALVILLAGMQAVQLVLYFIGEFLASHAVMGLGADVYRMLHSGWFSVAGSGLLSYALLLPVVERILEKVPEVRPEPRRMRRGKLVSFAVLVMGGGYLFNLLGVLLNMILSSMTGRSVFNMSPANVMITEMDWTTAVYVGVIAPVIEEYLFRGLILNRLRPLGSRAAIVFSALMFGLMHGNLSQFLYASAIGTIFGYIAVRTGRIFYSGLLHIMVNSYTVFIVAGVLRGSAATGLGALNGLIIIETVMFGFIIAAVIIFAVNKKNTKLKKGNWPAGVQYRDFSSAMFLNPGAAVFEIICISMIVGYAFLA